MERKPIYGSKWSESSLEHAQRLGQEVFQRAQARQVSWSPVKQRFYPREEICPAVTFDEAFDSMMNCLHKASRECWRYHANREVLVGCKDSEMHCKRFHCAYWYPPSAGEGNPVDKEGLVHVRAPPGTYTVTAHKRGTVRTEMKMAKLSDHGDVTLKFSL